MARQPVELTDSAKQKRHEALSTGKLPFKKPKKKSTVQKIKSRADRNEAARRAADKALGITRR